MTERRYDDRIGVRVAVRIAVISAEEYFDLFVRDVRCEYVTVTLQYQYTVSGVFDRNVAR